jgi:hypothetical protein
VKQGQGDKTKHRKKKRKKNGMQTAKDNNTENTEITQKKNIIA